MKKSVCLIFALFAILFIVSCKEADAGGDPTGSEVGTTEAGSWEVQSGTTGTEGTTGTAGSQSEAGDEEPVPANIRIEFANDTAGSAAGTYSCGIADGGLYYLCWCSGGAIADGFEPLAEKSVITGGTFEFTANDFCVIPAGIDGIALIKHGAGEPLYLDALPEEKLIVGEPLYAFGCLSDVHFGSKYGEGYAAVALRRALDLFARNGVGLVGISGDLTLAALKEEYAEYKATVDAFTLENPTIAVYSAAGNHDIDSPYGSAGGLIRWRQYTKDSDNYAGGLSRVYYDDNIYDYTVKVGEDIFIFLAQRRADYGTRTIRNIPEDQMQWLSDRFEENKDRNVYLFFHTFIDEEAGDADNGIYEYPLPLCRGAEDDLELRELLRKYKNVVMFSGHSHWEFGMQELINSGTGKENREANISNGGGEYCTLVHIPSVTAPRAMDPGASTRYYLVGEKSEGYTAYVYDGFTVLIGYDFISGKAIASASYIIPST